MVKIDGLDGFPNGSLTGQDLTKILVGVDEIDVLPKESHKLTIAQLFAGLPAGNPEIVASMSGLTGNADTGVRIGVNTSSGRLYYVNSSGVFETLPGQHSLVEGDIPTATENRVVSFGGNDITLTGAGNVAFNAITLCELTSPLLQLSSPQVEVRGTQPTVKFFDASDTNYVGLRAPTTGGNVSFSLPPSHPSTTQYVTVTPTGEFQLVDLPLDSNFQGVHDDLSDLAATIPTAAAGDWAILANTATDPTFAIWDTDAGPAAWVEVPTIGSIPSTNLGVSNVTSTSLDITSSTGTSATLPLATPAIGAGLMSAADKSKVDGIANIVSGALGTATGDRDVAMGSNQLRFLNTDTFSVQDVGGSSLIMSGNVTLTSTGTIALTAPTIEAYDSTIQTTNLQLGRSNDVGSVTIDTPTGLPGSYTVELFDDMPSPTEVTNGENWIRISDAGKLSYGAPVDTTWSSVANIAARDALNINSTGYRAKVTTNRLTYVYNGSSWIVDENMSTVTAAEMATMTEMEDGQLATVTDSVQGIYQWSSANGWQKF